MDQVSVDRKTKNREIYISKFKKKIGSKLLLPTLSTLNKNVKK